MEIRDQIEGVVRVAMALADAIRAHRSVPTGHLYALVCGKLSLDAFRRLIELLTKAGLVEERANVLHWVG